MDPSDYMKDPRPAVHSQLSTSLPGVNTFITTHDPETLKAKVHSSRQATWTPFDDKKFALSAFYTGPATPVLEDEKDLEDSDAVIEGKQLGLTREGGTVYRYCDFAPGYSCAMHRTASVDLGIVIEGEVELLLDDGSSTLARRGDTIVQRATMHAWRNASKTEWARMIFILQSTSSVKVGDKEIGEDLGAIGG